VFRYPETGLGFGSLLKNPHFVTNKNRATTITITMVFKRDERSSSSSSSPVEDEEEEEDDISNLKRLTRDAFADIKSLREKVHQLEAQNRVAARMKPSSSSSSIFHRVKAKVEAAIAPPVDDGFNITASNRIKRGNEVKVNCETHFPKIGCVLTSGFNAEGGKLVRFTYTHACCYVI